MAESEGSIHHRPDDKGAPSAIRLAFDLILVPRLFAQLLLWPLLIGIVVAASQAALGASVTQRMEEGSGDFSKRLQQRDPRAAWFRHEIFGRRDPFPQIEVCRWITRGEDEFSPNPGCTLHPFDVAVRVNDPATFDSRDYEQLFLGAVPRLHLCRHCSTEMVVHPNGIGGDRETDVYSLAGLGVLLLTQSVHRDEVNDQFIRAKAIAEHARDLTGAVWLHPPGAASAVNVSKTSVLMILTVNLCFLIIIGLWLAVAGHRRVLSYFACNDVLLPLVAACGKTRFYNAMWLITMLRVLLFLLCSAPVMDLVYVTMVPTETVQLFIGSPLGFVLWFVSIFSSLALMTVVASIADLKRRSSFMAFCYTYVPPICFLIGTALWVACLCIEGAFSRSAQLVITSLPMFGVAPVILSPIIRGSSIGLALHAALAFTALVVVMRNNARWFGAHLEEL